MKTYWVILNTGVIFTSGKSGVNTQHVFWPVNAKSEDDAKRISQWNMAKNEWVISIECGLGEPPPNEDPPSKK